eukprot:1013216-Amphidinium_carterae.1
MGKSLGYDYTSVAGHIATSALLVVLLIVLLLTVTVSHLVRKSETLLTVSGLLPKRSFCVAKRRVVIGCYTWTATRGSGRQQS